MQALSYQGKTVSKGSFDKAMIRTMSTSGATITVSGVILVAAFVFLALFPVNLIANMGLGCAITLLIMMAVNLTLVPALMSTFHRFFSLCISPKRSLGPRCGGAWQATV